MGERRLRQSKKSGQNGADWPKGKKLGLLIIRVFAQTEIPLISMPITLKQLFEKSQLLTTSVNESELPYIERRLDQIESQSKNLLNQSSKESQKPQDINSRAYVPVQPTNTN